MIKLTKHTDCITKKEVITLINNQLKLTIMPRTGYESSSNQELFDIEELYVQKLQHISTSDPTQDECLEELHFISLEAEQRIHSINSIN
jgi:hypothetical protein